MISPDSDSGDGWRRISRDSVSWLGSLLIHTSLLLLLALMTFQLPQTASDVPVTLGLDEAAESPSQTTARGRPVPPLDSTQAADALIQSQSLPRPRLSLASEVSLANLALPRIKASAHVASDPARDWGGAALSVGASEVMGATVGDLQGTTQGFQKMVGRLRGRGLDVVLVLDVTASMGPYLQQVKQRLHQVIEVIRGVLEDQGPTLRKVRFGVVAYKDYGDDFGPGACRTLKLSTDPTQIQRFLNNLYASGGGDMPEPIHRALHLGTDPAQMGWKTGRSAVVILIADAPVHKAGRHALPLLARRFVRRFGGKINVIDTGNVGRTQILDDLQVIAKAGRGWALLLKDDHAFWRHLIVSVFGRQYAGDVDLIIKRYVASGH